MASKLRRWRGALERAGSPDERIHAARVAFKEARALLRLFRDMMRHADAEAWDQRLREAMKALAPSRDLMVMNVVITAHAPQLKKEADRAAVLAALLPPLKPKSAAIRAVTPLLDEWSRFLGPVAHKSDWSRIDSALAQSLRRVRQLQRRAGKDDLPSVWHRWRRRVKSLGFQTDFARPPKLGDWKSLYEQAWRLQARLGTLQDLNITLDHVDSLDVSAKVKRALRTVLHQAVEEARRHAWQARLKSQTFKA